MKYLLMPVPSSTDIPDGHLLKTDKSKDFTYSYLTKELDNFTMPSDAKIDLSKGYWQISAAKEDVEKTAFVTSDGTYDFLRMPFGMKNSGATLVRGIRNILAEMSNVDSYIDDLKIHTNDWQAHLQGLEKLLRRLRKAELTEKLSKCLFGGRIR